MQLRLIINTVARDFNLDSKALLKGPNRTSTQKSPVREAREACFYLARKHVQQLSSTELAEALGVGAATIWYGATRAKARTQGDKTFRLRISRIEKKLKLAYQEGDVMNTIVERLSRIENVLKRIQTTLKANSKGVK